MKTIKLMMMLLCGVLMSVSFASCGSDDDDSDNGSSGGIVTKQEGKFTIAGKTFDVSHACYYNDNEYVVIALDSLDDTTSSRNPSSWVEIWIPTDKMAIPEGSVTKYEINGGLGPVGNYDNYQCYITSVSGDSGSYTPWGTQPCQIIKSGDYYTISIPDMTIKYKKYGSSNLSNTTCSLKFTGKIPHHSHNIK